MFKYPNNTNTPLVIFTARLSAQCCDVSNSFNSSCLSLFPFHPFIRQSKNSCEARTFFSISLSCSLSSRCCYYLFTHIFLLFWLIFEGSACKSLIGDISKIVSFCFLFFYRVPKRNKFMCQEIIFFLSKNLIIKNWQKNIKLNWN